MVGSIADFLRFAWGLIYWNTVKSVFQLSRGRARNPCQHPSDSGKAMETGCDPCQNWNRPSRFQRVCPLLVKTPSGYKCSVNASEVRPFWGKAFKFYGILSLSVYLTSAAAVFIFLRTVGYPVSVVQVIWPPKWTTISQSESSFFLNKANSAFQKNDVHAGLLALSNAYEADPHNYQVALEEAQDNEAQQPYISDAIYSNLLTEHPAKRSETASRWFRALLDRADYDQIAKLASVEVFQDKPRANIWMRALIFSTRKTRNISVLDEMLTRPEARVWAPLLTAEIDASKPNAPKQAPVGLWPPPMPSFGVYYQISGLIDSGDSLDALDELEQSRDRLDPASRVVLRLKGLAVAGDDVLREREIRNLFDGPISPQLMEAVCAHLILYPNPGALHALYLAMESREPVVSEKTVGAWLSIFCAAGAAKDAQIMHAVGIRLRNSPGAPEHPVQGLEAFFLKESAARHVTTFLPFIPLPIEVIYSLLTNEGGAAR